jgi:FKBP-type peptidyl-prolyl cis-trans isomerase
MKSLKNYLLIGIAVFALSCDDESDDFTPYSEYGNDSFESEMVKFNKYISDNNISSKNKIDEMYLIKESKADNENIKENDTLLLNINSQFLDGNVWLNSDIAFNNYKDLQVPIETVVSTKEIIEGVYKGLLSSNVGDKVKMIIPSSMAYSNKYNRYFLSPYTSLIYNVEILAKTKAGFKEYEKEKILQWALADSNKNVVMSNSGLLYQIIKQGESVSNATTYTIDYSSYYENLAPVYFKQDYDKNRYVKLYINQIESEGIKEALKLVGKGGEIVCYIPSYLLSSTTFANVPVKLKIKVNDLF